MDNAVNQLFQELALMRQEMSERLDSADQRFDSLERHFLELKATIDVQHAALLSAIMSLKPTP